MNILLCTLGASWQVVPEVFGFLAPSILDLYAHHPESSSLAGLRDKFRLREPDELWICTSRGRVTEKSLARVEQWWEALGRPVPLRIWAADDTDDLSTQRECEHIRELTLRTTLLASETMGPQGSLTLSLAGGRKTMSADLQWAGSVFGARAWLHVVGAEPLPAELKTDSDVAIFCHPLAPHLAAAITPLVVGDGSRDELLDIDINGKRVASEHFPLPLPSHRANWPMPPEGATLSSELMSRRRESSRILGNFLARLDEADPYENWRSLYRLAPGLIQWLRDTRVDADSTSWLRELPKAELHRHVGGCLSLAGQRVAARALWQTLRSDVRAAALDAVAPLLTTTRTDWDWDWPAALHQGSRAANCAALLVEAPDDLLMRNLYASTAPRLGLKTRHPKGFAAYERPGELTGSAILTADAALEAYAAEIIASARAEGLLYLELRGSPHKYRPDDPVGFCKALAAALRRAGAGTAAGPHVRFLWILDRRQSASIPQVVSRAAAARGELDDFLVGLDLAGDEGTQAPEQLAAHFTPAFRECLAITIHAGEGESAENIWQAAYQLHADRIGHGLTLRDNPRLQERFRDRSICLELCPTSNREVVGFMDPMFPESRGYPRYPLRDFIESGLPITLCTDNPGISRTTMVDEYLTAARMTRGGLSHWEALALIRQAFVHSFCDAQLRDTLLARADERIFAILSIAGASKLASPGSPVFPNIS